MSDDSDFSKDSDVMDDEFLDEDNAEIAEAKSAPKTDGFADMMSKILNQKVGGKIPVLAKRKTTLMKEAEGNSEDQVKLKKQRLDRKLEKEKQLQAPDQGPAATDFERQLRKLATRGVVALFNAIAKVKREAAAVAAGDDAEDDQGGGEGAKKTPTEGKSAKQLTHEGFLELLKGGAPAGRGTGTGTEDNNEDEDEDDDDENRDDDKIKSTHKKDAAPRAAATVTAGATTKKGGKSAQPAAAAASTTTAHQQAAAQVVETKPGWSALQDDYDYTASKSVGSGGAAGKGKKGGPNATKGKLALKNWDKDDSSDGDDDEEAA